MRRCTQSRRNLCIDGKNDLLLLLLLLVLFSSFRAFLPATHVCEEKITADVYFPRSWNRLRRGIGFMCNACAAIHPRVHESNILLIAGEDCATRSSSRVEARNDDDDPSKMEEEGAEGRGAARLSFLMSIGSDSLLNAAMISRSGRGRTRVSSAGSRDRDSIRGDVGCLLGFSPPTSVCDSCYRDKSSLGEFGLEMAFSYRAILFHEVVAEENRD